MASAMLSGLVLCRRTKKIYDITFVGTVNQERIKRRNIISWISRAFNINVVQGIDMRQAQNIFAQSKIVLNENLFSGLTLRVLQGLASGALVATEKNGAGVDDFFSEGHDFLAYGPDDVLEKLDHILKSDMEREWIAHNGHEACAARHTSLARASQFINTISNGRARNQRKSPEEIRWYRLCASYMFTLRFGGRLRTVLKAFCEIANAGGPHAAEAAIRAGDIFFNFGNIDQAEKQYQAAISLDTGHIPFARMAMLYLGRDDVTKAKGYMNLALKRIPPDAKIFDSKYTSGLFKG